MSFQKKKFDLLLIFIENYAINNFVLNICIFKIFVHSPPLDNTSSLLTDQESENLDFILFRFYSHFNILIYYQRIIKNMMLFVV